MNNIELREKVRVIAANILEETGYISPVELLMKLEYLTKKSYTDWRNKKVPYLERVCSVNLSKLSTIMKELKKYAKENNLKSSWTAYNKWGIGQKIRLIFSKSGNPNIEKSYATHYLKPKNK